MRGTLLSLQGKSVDGQPWQPGDLRKGRLDPYKVARPPGVRVALLLNGSVIITANCGNGDVRPCDSIREAAELAARLNQAVRDQIVADERLKELMRESLDVIGETDARLDAADKAAAATNAAAVATVRRAEDANGHGGRKIFRNALALVQRSCDVASSQFSVAGLDFQAALPAADKTQGALLLGSHVHAPPPAAAEGTQHLRTRCGGARLEGRGAFFRRIEQGRERRRSFGGCFRYHGPRY